jgi:hypothetical protein
MKNEEAYRLVKELADREGKSMTTVVIETVREKLERQVEPEIDHARVEHWLKVGRELRAMAGPGSSSALSSPPSRSTSSPVFQPNRPGNQTSGSPRSPLHGPSSGSSPRTPYSSTAVMVEWWNKKVEKVETMPSLSIKNQEAYSLINELADLEGKSMTTVVIEAVREKLERERKPQINEARVQHWLDFGQRVRKTTDPELLALNPDDILYDENGLPE